MCNHLYFNFLITSERSERVKNFIIDLFFRNFIYSDTSGVPPTKKRLFKSGQSIQQRCALIWQRCFSSWVFVLCDFSFFRYGRLCTEICIFLLVKHNGRHSIKSNLDVFISEAFLWSSSPVKKQLLMYRILNIRMQIYIRKIAKRKKCGC